MARSRSYGRTSAAGASLMRSCSRAGGGSTSPAPGNESRLRRRARRGRWRLIGRDSRQASDQAERWSLVTRPATRLSTVSAAQALYSLAFAAAQLRNPGTRVPQLNGAPGHADRHRRRSPTCTHRETLQTPGHTFEPCSNQPPAEMQTRHVHAPNGQRSQLRSRRHTLSLLTCNKGIVTHSSA
jgi:hypothetical protein